MHKCISQCKSFSQCTNLFLSTQIYFSVYKYISQRTNVFLSAKMYFSVHKCISQCLVTWFSRAFLLLGWDVLLLSFALQIDRPQPRIQASSRYPSYQRGLGTECPRRIFPTSLTGGVTRTTGNEAGSAFETILIPHRKACFVLAVALKCKFPFHFVLVVAGALKVLMTQIAFHV